MENPETERRFGARVVAYLDLVFSVFLCVLTFGLITLQFHLYQTVEFDHQSYNYSGDSKALEEIFNLDVKSAESMFLHVGWLFVVIGLIYSSISLYGAIALLKATKLEANPYPALRNALIWRNIAVVFMVFRVMGIFIGGVMYGIVMTANVGIAVINGICLWIVLEFILELEKATKLPTTQGMRMTEKSVPSTLSIV